ncbi:MAG TPA: DUF2127 domain-containing protein [Gemmatimonadales bacterium]|nr:DUF2127 domain-containing protein [Gemmatimonadales bacterium]
MTDANRPLRVIAVFKFFQAALFVVVALGALELLRPVIALRAQHWADAVAVSADRRAVQRLLVSVISGLSFRRLEVLGIIASLFATLFTIEGVGLWLARRWAEYLTVLASLVFVPVEVFELMRRISPTMLTALTLNLAIAGYLIIRLRRSRTAMAATRSDPADIVLS